MSEKNMCTAKLRQVLIQFCVFGLPLFALIDAQGLTPNKYKVRQMFNGDNVEDIIYFNLGYDNLCIGKNLNLKKDFTSPVRRVSEVKCLEYIWDSIIKVEKENCYVPIVGGRPALYGEFPHMGALGWKSAKNSSDWVFMCGASLISERYMLTAAHCSYVPRRYDTIANPTPEIVKIGDNFIKNKIGGEDVSKYVAIKRIIKHELYKAPIQYYDIALIELEKDVKIGAIIRPACLWSSPDTSTIDELTITGWGVVNPVTRTTSNELQVAGVNLVDDSTCDSTLKEKRNRKWMGLAEHQICAGFLRGRVDTCQGDSGGPLQVKINLTRTWPMYYVVGVTSFGYGCAHANIPGVYVKTSSFIDWIESIVWPNA